MQPQIHVDTDTHHWSSLSPLIDQHFPTRNAHQCPSEADFPLPCLIAHGICSSQLIRRAVLPFKRIIPLANPMKSHEILWNPMKCWCVHLPMKCSDAKSQLRAAVWRPWVALAFAAYSVFDASPSPWLSGARDAAAAERWNGATKCANVADDRAGKGRGAMNVILLMSYSLGS